MVTLRHRPHRVIFVPLDDRPCSVKAPRLLARMVDYELLIPPLELLGQFQTPGQPESVATWLLEQLHDPTDAIVLSLDMLAYGGLTAACSSGTRSQLAQDRLDFLAKIRQAAPNTPILAHSSIMRLAITASSDETARYWSSLRSYAVLAGRVAQSDDAQLSAELERLERNIPGAVLGEYLAIRQRNHELNLRAVSELAEGNINFLLLCQDDADQNGLHITEQATLRAEIHNRDLDEKALICDSPEHAGPLLLARFIHEHMEKTPRVRVLYSTPEDAETTPPLECRPFAQSIATLVKAVGGQLTQSRRQADLTLVVNTPAPQPRGAYKSPAARRERARLLGEFIDEVAATEAERGVAICDAAFPNGADDAFTERLVASALPLPRLLAYSGARAASEAVGKCLAHGTLRLIALQDKGAFNLAHTIGELSPMRYLSLLNSLIDAEKAHIELLFQRLVSDWLYQTRVRPRATMHLVTLVRSAMFDLQDTGRHAEDIVHDRLAHAAADLWIESFLGKDCAEIGTEEYRSRLTLAELEETRARLPWRRLAEVDLEIEFGMQLVAER